MTFPNAILAVWDRSKMNQLTAELQMVSDSISAIKNSITLLEPILEHGDHIVTSTGVRCESAQDYYHPKLAGLQVNEIKLERRIATLQRSLDFTMRTLV